MVPKDGGRGSQQWCWRMAAQPCLIRALVHIWHPEDNLCRDRKAVRCCGRACCTQGWGMPVGGQFYAGLNMFNVAHCRVN
ncbi:hypothetical protein DUNSADRAFT_9288 [Dunaliella salina]|uniref:Encoded protein n=1 Tax=Dunaliella salina TaxID=3046 RepID=A0ABQ7GHQ8_DUNSA|nr:hypothetical protein DUNSADRAFT_9288 [Dunaliella salina]|eukprot:KAF5834127.1 hypothetical protein DUNSADRAFT_9288 [Dunaliella salina]